MNDEFVKSLVEYLFSGQYRELNLLEWKFEGGILTLKLEDMEDGLIGIYTVEYRFSGYADSLNKGDFNCWKRSH